MGTRSKTTTKEEPKKIKRSSRKPLPWERQETERIQSFEGFIVYRDIQDRTFKKVAEILGSSYGTVESLAYRNNWQERANAWDNEVDRRLRAVEISELEKMVKRQVGIAQGMQEAGTLELKALIAWIKENDTKAAKDNRVRRPLIKVNDIISLIDNGTKLERLNRDQPGEVNEVRAKSWAEMLKEVMEGTDSEILP